MASQAGRIGAVKVCATEGGTYYEPNGLTSAKPGNGWKTPTMMDTTRLRDTATRQESSGFFDASLSISVIRDAADTNGQGVLLATNPVWVQYSEDNSAFKKCLMAWTCDESHQAGTGSLVLNFSFTPAGGLAPATV